MRKYADTTVILCARNASKTIGRAIKSVVSQADCPILVVDDYSSDDTVGEAAMAGRGRVSFARPDRKAGLGNARETGIRSIDTKYAIWLDADDEFLPGRIDRFIDAMQKGADVVFDACELFDGATGRRIRELAIPDFMKEAESMVRTFERNYLPGPAWPGVNTAFAKRVGYDRTLPTGEDIDFNLRALAQGARFRILSSAGYRQYHYPGSLSRNIDLQRNAVATALSKHVYAEVRALFDSAGFDERVANWALCSMAIFRQEYDVACDFLEKASPETADPAEILDPRGPWPYAEGWKRSFFWGTLRLLLGSGDALGPLIEAEKMRATAEGANNLGVALHRLGRELDAEKQFRLACQRLPGYRDALLNQQSSKSSKLITTHPLRSHASRDQYDANRVEDGDEY